MRTIITALIISVVALATGAPARAEVCGVIDGIANVGDICVCPSGTTKRPLARTTGSFICDDGTEATQQVLAGKVCCVASGGSGSEACRQAGVQYVWMTRSDCRAAPQGAECPTRLCIK